MPVCRRGLGARRLPAARRRVRPSREGRQRLEGAASASGALACRVGALTLQVGQAGLRRGGEALSSATRLSRRLGELARACSCAGRPPAPGSAAGPAPPRRAGPGRRLVSAAGAFRRPAGARSSAAPGPGQPALGPLGLGLDPARGERLVSGLRRRPAAGRGQLGASSAQFRAAARCAGDPRRRSGCVPQPADLQLRPRRARPAPAFTLSPAVWCDWRSARAGSGSTLRRSATPASSALVASSSACTAWSAAASLVLEEPQLVLPEVAPASCSVCRYCCATSACLQLFEVAVELARDVPHASGSRACPSDGSRSRGGAPCIWTRRRLLEEHAQFLGRTR